MKPSTFKTLLFDLDGTLVDNFQALYHAYLYTCKQLRIKAVSFPEMRKLVGGSIPVTIAQLMGKDKRIKEAITLFTDHFQKIMFDDLTLLPGAQWLLESLHDKHYTIAVFTNKAAEHARKICDHLKLTNLVNDIIGVGETPYRKPQPEFTQYALNRLSASPQTSLLIGDSPYDAESASVVGMPYALVTTGTHPYEELVTLTPKPLGVFEDLYALGEALFNLEKPSPTPVTLS